MLLGLPSTPAQTLTTVHVISLPIDAGAEVYYGKAMGFFAKAGIDVDILPHKRRRFGVRRRRERGRHRLRRHGLDLLALTQASTSSSSFRPRCTSPPRRRTNCSWRQTLRSIRQGPRRKGRRRFGSRDDLRLLAESLDRSERRRLDVGQIRRAAVPRDAGGARRGASRRRDDRRAVPGRAQKIDRVIGSPYDAVSKDFLISAYFINAAVGEGSRRPAQTLYRRDVRNGGLGKREHAKSAELLLNTRRSIRRWSSAMTRVRYGERLTAAMLQPVVDVSAKYGGFATVSGAAVDLQPPPRSSRPSRCARRFRRSKTAYEIQPAGRC